MHLQHNGTTISCIKNIKYETIKESDEESNKEKYDTLEEVYAKWQSQPATEEQWDEMNQEIQQAIARERKNNTPLEVILVESDEEDEPDPGPTDVVAHIDHERSTGLPNKSWEPRRKNTPLEVILVESDEEDEPDPMDVTAPEEGDVDKKQEKPALTK
jgi:hypothetical protein